jgi:hypothetical protein
MEMVPQLDLMPQAQIWLMDGIKQERMREAQIPSCVILLAFERVAVSNYIWLICQTRLAIKYAQCIEFQGK